MTTRKRIRLAVARGVEIAGLKLRAGGVYDGEARTDTFNDLSASPRPQPTKYYLKLGADELKSLGDKKPNRTALRSRSRSACDPVPSRSARGWRGTFSSSATSGRQHGLDRQQGEPEAEYARRWRIDHPNETLYIWKQAVDGTPLLSDRKSQSTGLVAAQRHDQAVAGVLAAG